MADTAEKALECLELTPSDVIISDFKMPGMNGADLLANEKVRVAQQSAIANEKLAGIGLLAAGVAHEINNPRCFVTANIRSLIEALASLRGFFHSSAPRK